MENGIVFRKDVRALLWHQPPTTLDNLKIKEAGKFNYDKLSALSEKAMAPHSSTLAWKIPWTEEPVRLQSMGSLRVGHDWATSLSFFTFMHWRRKWQPTPVFLPGESHSAILCSEVGSPTFLKCKWSGQSRAMGFARNQSPLHVTVLDIQSGPKAHLFRQFWW